MSFILLTHQDARIKGARMTLAYTLNGYWLENKLSVN